MTFQISGQHSAAGWPREVGCLVPSTGRYGSLYIWMYLGPHQSNSGKRLASRRLTIMRMLGDQSEGGPMGVCDQSSARIRSPISPPPRRKSSPAACVAPRDGAARSVMSRWPGLETVHDANVGEIASSWGLCRRSCLQGPQSIGVPKSILSRLLRPQPSVVGARSRRTLAPAMSEARRETLDIVHLPAEASSSTPAM